MYTEAIRRICAMVRDSGVNQAQLTSLATVTPADFAIIDQFIAQTFKGFPRIISYAITGLTTSAETLAGVTLPTKCIILDTWIDITTLDAAGLTWGTKEGGGGGGDLDGHASIATDAAGIIRPGVALDGTGNWYATNTRGVLLSKFQAGTNADDRGLYLEFPDLTGGAKILTYTPASATPLLVGRIYYLIIEL
jgi:hypothetical protein